MNFSLKLVDTVSDVNKKIKVAIADKINVVFRKALKPIEDSLRPLVVKALQNEPEYGSLISGKLRYDFGIRDSGSISRVVEALAASSTAKLRPVTATGGRLSGGISIGFMKTDDMSGLIYTDLASVITEDSKVLPWLEWLLYHGTSPIIKRYQVEYGPNPNSRTGNAIMVHSQSDWSVPSNFSGRVNDNWTTRAASKISDNEITNIVQKNIERYI